MIPDRHKKKAAWLAICLGCTASAEGIRQTAYRDPAPAGNWTYCFGETRHPDGRPVRAGDHATRAECEALLEGRLFEFGAAVDKCTTVELPPARKAAMTDFAYNEGAARYCKYIAPQLNAGKTREACDHLLRFNTAGGVVFPGLTKRREVERGLCLEGLA